MNVLVINGSPRRSGNTSLLLKDLMMEAEVKGADATYFDLAAMKLRGCQGCMHCKREEGCAIDDDMSLVYPRIREADVVILGTPIYFGAETGLTKCFVDRLYALLAQGKGGRGTFISKLQGGKKAVVLFTCGTRDGDIVLNYMNMRYFDLFVNLLGFSDIRTFIIGGMNPAVDARGLPKAKTALAECKRFINR
jgi:multimeric flavodoxin WrbA